MKLIVVFCIIAASVYCAEEIGFDLDSDSCPRLANKTTVVIYTGPFKPPYLPELLALPSLNPELASNDNVWILNLSDPTEAACSRAIKQVKRGSLLVYWEDGNLSASSKSFPQLMGSLEGSVAVFGKTGRTVAGISSLTLLSSLESLGGSLFLYDLDALADLKVGRGLGCDPLEPCS